MGSLWQDLRYAVRVLAKSPGFTAVAVLTLALGIGANTAIFTVMDAALWKMLPVTDPQQLVKIETRSFPTPVLREFLDEGHNYGFSGVLGHVEDGLSLEVDGQAERVMGDVVTPNYFAVLGVKPFLGQMFSERVVSGSWQPEVVLPYDFWKRRFGGNNALVGRTIHLNGYAFTVVGVSPPGFSGVEVGLSPEVRIPMLVNGLQTMPALPLLDPSTQSNWDVMARLKPGVSERQAQAMADSFIQRLVRASPRMNQDRHLQVSDGSRGSSWLEDYEKPLEILMCLVGMALLIACANLANLLLGRATARQREIAVRLALGATRMRLVRQLLTESILLSVSGAMLGIFFSMACTRVMLFFLPQTHISLSLDLHLDVRALAFTFVVAVVTGIAFGLAPAFQTTRPNLAPALKGDASLMVRKGKLHFELRNILMILQVAISVLLLVGSGLFIRSLGKLKSIEPGFSADRVLLFTMKHVHERYTTVAVTNFSRQLVEHVEGLPGVRSAALTDGGPFSGRVDEEIISVPGQDQTTEGTITGLADAVGPGFFRTLGVPFLLGRDFSVADQIPGRKVAILNDVAVHDFFMNQDPIGKRVILGRAPEAEEFEIIGVVKGFKYNSLKEQMPPEVFVPMQGMPWMPVLAVRTSANPNLLIQPILREFRNLDKDLPVFNIKTMETQVGESLAPERLVATLAGFFGALATLLASIGIYGVLSFYVTRRTREIGIRMALGAQPADVIRIIVGQGLRLVLVGLVLGLIGAVVLTRLISSLLYGVRPTDPVTLIGVVVLLLGVTFVACYIPARRAAKVDPMVALRYE